MKLENYMDKKDSNIIKFKNIEYSIVKFKAPHPTLGDDFALNYVTLLQYPRHRVSEGETLIWETKI